MSPVLRTLALGGCLALALSGAARAQFIRPGGGLEPTGTRTLITLQGDSESALWHVGPFRVTPRLGLQDLRYDSNATSPTSDEEGDLTATFGAGFDAYLPVGPDSILEFTVLPAYVYWAEFSEQNRLVGNYRVGYLGDFNRLHISLEAEQREEIEFETPELLQRLPSERLDLEGSIELDFTSNFALRIQGRERRVRLDEPEAGFEPGLDSLRLLDRDESRARAGLVWKSGEEARLEVGMQREDNDFRTANRANEGDSPYLAARLEGNRLELDLDVVQRSLEPKEGETFEPVEDTTGRFRLTLAPGWRIRYSVYGERLVGYSVDSTLSHFEDERRGLGLTIRLSERANARLFAEEGDLTYVGAGGVSARPAEEISAYGANLSFQVSERSSFRIGGGHFEIESPLPDVTREWDFFTAGFTVTFSRVRVDVGSGI